MNENLKAGDKIKLWNQSVIILFDSGESFVYTGFSNIKPKDSRKIKALTFTQPKEDFDLYEPEEKFLEYKG